MFHENLLTLLFALLLGAVFVYQSSFLKKKKLWHLSLQQVLELVILPGIFIPLVFSYLQSLTRQPLAGQIFLSDRVVLNIIILSILLLYAGVSIHAVTKVLSDQFHLYGGPSEVIEVNRFFHMTFSHNLGYAGAYLAILGMSLLELNHIPDYSSVSILGGVGRGLMLALALALAVYNYTRYTTGDIGRWSDLKVVFGVFWLGFVVLLYSIQKMDPRLTDYQLLIPVLLSFSVMIFLSIILAVRRVGRTWQVRVRRKALDRYLRGEDED